jgi:hypothetical protein
MLMVVLLSNSALLLGCSARSKVPQGPPPEYERTELSPWPPAASASTFAPTASGEPPAVKPEEEVPQPANSASAAPEAIDPPHGSR